MKNKMSKELKRYNYLFGETSAAYHDMYLKLGLSNSAMSILYTILENDGSCLLQDICYYTGLSKQTINSSIRKLEKEDIVYLDNVGLKNKIVYLTDKGKILAEKTAGYVIKAENEIFASWTQNDVEKYLELTEAFMIALKEKTKNIKI